ncbi:hypothetical protein EYF80_034555 [Liparis tanakae]|uniref:Uncharacterized protein n=1 Tax=Liparis tanakae TaxID=230148 RepID=A0A4Z2GR66_9TELE|nr:hypothetical protein EYF80_034555 [Liparis tanakae]
MCSSLHASFSAPFICNKDNTCEMSGVPKCRVELMDDHLHLLTASKRHDSIVSSEVLCKGNVVLHKGFEVLSMGRHELDGVLPEPQPEPEGLQLIGETDELRRLVAVLRPVLAVLHDGPARRPLVLLAFQFAPLVAASGF